MARRHPFEFPNPFRGLVPAAAGGSGDDQPPILFFASGGGGSGDDEKRTVRAGRRRKTEKTADERERAEAPRRRDREPAAKRPSAAAGSGTTRPVSSGGMKLPVKGSPLLMLIVIILVVVCGLPIALITGLFPGGGDSGIEEEGAELPLAPTAQFEEAAQPTPMIPDQPFEAPVVSSDGQTWLVMLYQDADDKVLEQDIYLDLNEAEKVGSSDRVHIVAQVDRFRGAYQGDGDWTSTKRFYITRDDDLQRVTSQVVEDLGEANMSDGDTLVDFVTWAVETFPADRHVLIMADHGMGWPGGWSDPAPGAAGDQTIPLSARLGDQLFLMELDGALQTIRERTGIGQFELVGMDACLMGHLEVFSALVPHARFAVASQETEPAVGWAYTGFLRDLVANPDMDGSQLGRAVVDSYIVEDQRVVDDEARADFLGQSSPLSGLFGMLGGLTANQLSDQLGENITMTAVDLAAVPPLLDSVNNLAFTLQSASQKDVAEARTYAQSFTSIFGDKVPPSYIDLGNFVQILKQESASLAVGDAVDGVLAALDTAVVAERHGPKKPGASGVSLYFPNSQLYGSPVTGPESYTAIADRFAEVSLWDDFLAFHYTGRRFEAGASEMVIPERGGAPPAPGAEPLSISPITLSDDRAAPGEPVLISADVAGETIGYVYLFVGFVDESANSIFVADSDYLESSVTKELDGVYYPDWGEGEFTLEFEWEPVVFAIDDGTNTVVALFTPQNYGATFEEALYTVDGIYTFADDGTSRHARLTFNDGHLRQIFAFTGEEGVGAPREVIPQEGDTFTVLETWYDLDDSGEVVGTARQEGGTLTFGDQMFTWEELNAAAGEYIVGFIVSDLDGNQVQAYERVTVE